MKKIIKRVSAAVVALAVMLTAALLDVPEKAAAAEIVQSGSCGDNITWTLDADGVLTISGTGAMPNYGIVTKTPWNELKDQIKSVAIENGVTSIGSYAFYQCTSLTSADLPDSVKVLGNCAFRECSKLRKMIIPDSVTSITGTSTFYGCAQLAEVMLSNNLTALPESMFNRCSALKSITIPDSVTEIGQDVFSRCTSLTSLTIPSSVQTIGEEIAGWCSGLKTVVIENGLTSLSLKAFFECSGLTSVTLPESLTKIDGGAFNRCKSLKSITIPENVTSIGNNAFSTCNALENITIPDSVTSIGLQAFSDCKALKNITIPKSVTSIGKEVFKGCTLNEVRFGGETPPTLPANIDLCTATSTEKITVPCTAVDQYKTADGFSNLADKISGKHTLTKTEAKSPTCTEDGNKEYWHCSECGKYFSDSACTNVITDTVITQTGHYYNATWSSDDTNHWHECSRCDDKIDIANHTFVQKSDGTNHWEECSYCKYKNGEAAHSWGDWTLTTEPTLNTTGTAERTCSCGQKQTKTDVSVLTDDTVWVKGDRIDPTLNGTGSENYTSTDYGEVTITIPALTDPTWKKDDTQHVEPSEEQDGKDVYKSDDYGEVTVVLPQLDHTHVWGNWMITAEPTLTATGTAKRVCTKNTEHTETEILPILTDTSVWTKVDDKHVDPTENNDGKDVYTSEYGEVTDILPALVHTHEWGKWTITTAPTLTETGTAQRVCTLNDTHIDTKTLPVLTDNFVWTKDENKHVPPTEQTEGEDVYTSEYGEVTNPLDKLPHTHDTPLKYVPEVKPTEDDDGVKEHWHCDGCGKDFEDEDGTKEVTADDLKIGKIKMEVQAPVNVPKPEIATPKEELIAAALTEDEQKKVDEGTDIKIILKVEDASSTVSAEDKGNVETAIGNLTDHKLGQYLDVTLLKKIGEEREQKITETNAPIKVTFEIPEGLRRKAEYSVIRVHDGTTTILPDLDSEPNTVTIETDKFSTYALTYKEKTTTSDSGDDSNGENPGGNSDTTSNVDNSSDTTSNGSDTNSSGGTSSSDESNHALSESSPSEDNGNPSTGIAVSLVPLTAALAAMVIIAKHRRK